MGAPRRGDCRGGSRLRARPKGRCPFGFPARGPAPGPPRRAFGPLDSRAGGLARGCSFAGVTARNGRAATRGLPRGFAPAGATKGLCARPLETFAPPDEGADSCSGSSTGAGSPSHQPVEIQRKIAAHTASPQASPPKPKQQFSLPPPKTPLSAASAASRIHRVAARLSRAVTPSREKPRSAHPHGCREGRRPFAGVQRAAPSGGVSKGAAPLWRGPGATPLVTFPCGLPCGRCS